MKKIKVNFTDCSVWSSMREQLLALLKKHYRVELSEKPDFLFYSVFGSDFRNYKNCVKVFITGENVSPNFNECDYGIGFDPLDFGERYLRYYYAWNALTPDMLHRENLSSALSQRKFCNFVYSNSSHGEGPAIRQDFCRRLMEYKHVDCPGKVLHNLDDAIEPRDGDWEKGKLDFIQNYKFTIAFENSRTAGYTTEKLVQPFVARSVPIYWGNPEVVKDFNPKAFINCNDYGNDFDKVIERIIELDNDDEKYMEMLRQPVVQPDYDFNLLQKYEDFLVHIIEKGNQPFVKDPLLFNQIQFYALKNENNKLKARLQDINSEWLVKLCRFLWHSEITKTGTKYYLFNLKLWKNKNRRLKVEY